MLSHIVTSFLAVAVADNLIDCAWLGDCAAFLIRDGHVTRIGPQRDIRDDETNLARSVAHHGLGSVKRAAPVLDVLRQARSRPGRQVLGTDPVGAEPLEHAGVLGIAGDRVGGGRLAVEALTYPLVKGIAARLGVTPVAVPVDEHGMVPEALADAHRAAPLGGVYLQPTLHNPYGTTMPEARRAGLGALLGRLGLCAIEDRIWAFLREDGPPPLASFAPDHTIPVDSLSKRLAPGLSVGFAAVPRRLAGRVAAALRHRDRPAHIHLPAPGRRPIALKLVSDRVRLRNVRERTGRLVPAPLDHKPRHRPVHQRVVVQFLPHVIVQEIRHR